MRLIVRIKGGPGSGNWAHIGRPGVVGGSAPRDSGMTISKGSDWLQRYEAKAGHSHPFKAVIEKDREEAAKKAEEDKAKKKAESSEKRKADAALKRAEEKKAREEARIRVREELLAKRAEEKKAREEARIRAREEAKAKKKAEAEAAKKAEAEARKNRIPINADTKAEVEEYVRRRYSTEELEIATASLEEITRGKPVSMRVPSRILLDNILPEGKFKNQHQTRTSKGTLDPERRKRAERNGFGADLKKPDDFPVYGYIESKLGNADHYGDVRVVFKPAVRKRTTITVGDSLSNLENRHVVPSPIDKLGIECFDHNIRSGKKGEFYGNYIEAQIHGGLTLDDIDFIDLSLANSNYKKSIISVLNSKGIRYTE